MEIFNYYFTLTNRISGKLILKNVSNVSALKHHMSSGLFDYIESEVAIGRLSATKLEDDNVVCSIKKIVGSKAV